MSIVSINRFNAYTNDYEEGRDELKETYLDSAEQVVRNYIGYDPRPKEYNEFVSGTGDYKLYLNAKNITNIGMVIVNGVPIDPCELDIHDDYIFHRCRKKVFANGVDNIKVIYNAGYREMPELIILSIMRIAALMMAEQGGNIGITGKSFDDNSRTYINYQNYDKYLRPLDPFRVIRFNG